MRPTTGAVAINARAAVRVEIGGVERFARELALRLPAVRPDRYQVVCPPRRFAHRMGHAWEQGLLPALASRAELILSPANLAPLISRRSVVVIHDAAALRHPEAYSRSYVAYHRHVLPAIADRAVHVITVSEFSRRELVALLGVDPHRVSVIAEGVDERFSPSADSGPPRRRYGLSGPYVLVVGTLSDRKNLSVLTQAARALRERGIELVIAGSDRGYLRGGTIRTRRLGYVAEPDLPGLYAGATAVLMPSRHEGFGLPCLEAMASGVPVIAASSGALPETCGDAAILLEPDAPDAFADAAIAVALNGATRDSLSRAGLERARRFSWDSAAFATDELISGLLRDA